MRQYLKTYTEITSGTMAGRDDGYPYTELRLLKDMNEVAKYHGTKRDEKYFVVEAVNEKEFETELQIAKEQIEEEKKEAELAKKRKVLAELKAELGED